MRIYPEYSEEKSNTENFSYNMNFLGAINHVVKFIFA